MHVSPSHSTPLQSLIYILYRWANATTGQNCSVENTAYIAYGDQGEEFIDIVSRYGLSTSTRSTIYSSIIITVAIASLGCTVILRTRLASRRRTSMWPATQTKSESSYFSASSKWLTCFPRCSSFNCLATGVCGKSASAPNHFGGWVYVVVGFGIFGGE